MAETIPTTALLLIDESRQEEINVSHTPFTIGRLQDRDLVLAHPFISRDHAAIVYEKGQFHVVDCGSRHGTFLNAQPLVDRQPLKLGDEIRLGSLNGPSLRFGPPREATSTIHKLLDELHAISTPTSDLEKLSWFLAAAQRLNTLGAVNEILATLVEATLELTQVERGYVFLRDEKGKLTLAAGRSLKGAQLEDDSTISHSAIAQALKASKFIVTDTLSAEANSRTESMVQQSIRMVYCIPLRKRAAGADMSGERYSRRSLPRQPVAGRQTEPGRQRSSGDDFDRSRRPGGECISGASRGSSAPLSRRTEHRCIDSTGIDGVCHPQPALRAGGGPQRCL